MDKDITRHEYYSAGYQDGYAEAIENKEPTALTAAQQIRIAALNAAVAFTGSLKQNGEASIKDLVKCIVMTAEALNEYITTGVK